jgi:hypothetical protein
MRALGEASILLRSAESAAERDREGNLMRKTVGALVLAVLAQAGLAAANPINSPVPSNAYLADFDGTGLDWAWAAPCPQPGDFCGDGAPSIDLTYQSTQGWRLPTVDELMNSPLATNFVFAGANVPYMSGGGGIDPVSGAQFHVPNSDLTGDAACATPYFSAQYYWCDWQDGRGEPNGPWAGMPGAESFAEQLVVRAAVPEPGALGLLGVAGLVGFAIRRRRA